MQVLFIVLNKTKYLDEVLAKFLALGVKGATILDSQGMAGAMADAEGEIPNFGFLHSFMENAKPYSKTIFTVLKNEEMVEQVVEGIKEVLGEKAKKGAGFMFSIPIGKMYLMSK
ncbi:MAG: hypothetical protein GX786_05155 [Clostridiales bacterium]|nr:hypothetical protein [Clostridiales bacterium]